MTVPLEGTIQGSTILLDRAVPALEGRRVRVSLEPDPLAADTPPGDEADLSFQPPMAQLIGRKVLSTAPDGTVELEFDGSPRFANRLGTIQGGMLAAMLDSSLGIAMLALRGPGQRSVTVEMTTRYFRPAQPGPIRARASVLHHSSSLAHVQSSLFDPSGELLAHAVGCMRMLGAK